FVDLRSVGGKREGFSTLEAAQARAEIAQTERQDHGHSAFTMPMDLRLDAVKANAILGPHGITLLGVAEYYSEHVLAYKTSPLIKDLVKLYLAEGKQVNNRVRTLSDKKSRLETFAEDFGEKQLFEITVDDLKDWLFDDDWEPRTQINYITKIS